MPIPPRPIPSNRTSRPGTSVPRKSPLSLDKSDWRSELSLISNQPRSLPSHNGVKVMEQAKFDFEKVTQAVKGVEDVIGKREVGVEGLIVDGRGRREKRVTTATTLGFDFIPNPSILALPEDKPLAPSSRSSSNKHKVKVPVVLLDGLGSGRASPASLSGTPITPALIPVVEDEEVEALEDDDWEYVGREDAVKSVRGKVAEDEDDCDLCVLGELELEDAPVGFQKTGVGRTRSREVSYAAAAIGSRAVQVSL